VVIAASLSPPAGSRGIDEILGASRARLDRVTPHDAYAAQRDGAILVDIRPAGQRGQEGEIPGALIIERNVLEWRLDPRSDARLPVAKSYDLRVIVVCQEGYTSSLAAAALHDLGLHRATDLAGGFAAWQSAGLPTTRKEEGGRS
jgi:rhodanese-related sulfurtransferase